jgi:transcriptional regulator with XRE-family HTH domain
MLYSRQQVGRLKGNEMSKHLGEYLRDLRHTKGLTTRQLAGSAGCSHAFVTLLESGQRFPSLDRLWRIVGALDGDLGTAFFLLCLDAGIPGEAARGVVLQDRRENRP